MENIKEISEVNPHHLFDLLVRYPNVVFGSVETSGIFRMYMKYKDEIMYWDDLHYFCN